MFNLLKHLVFILWLPTVVLGWRFTWVEHGHDRIVPNGGNFTIRYRIHRFSPTAKDLRPDLEVRVHCMLDRHQAIQDVPALFKFDMMASILPGSTATEGILTLGPLIHFSSAAENRCGLKVHRRMRVQGFTVLLPVDSGADVVFSVRRPRRAVQLSLSADGRGMYLTWPSSAKDDNVSSVTFHPTHRPSAWKKATVHKQSYDKGDLCGTPASKVQHNFHYGPVISRYALLSLLIPDTQYTCRIGDEEHVFRSPKKTGGDDQARVIVLGNMGVFHGHHHGHHDVSVNRYKHGTIRPRPNAEMTKLLNHLQTQLSPPMSRNIAPDLVVHTGNLAYACGRAYIWDYFLHYIAPIASKVPYHVIGGEREVDFSQVSESADLARWAKSSNASGGECGVPLQTRFRMPVSSSSTPGSNNGKLWYSHAVRNMYMVYISTEHDLGKGSAQAVWLERELSSVDRRAYPWLIVFGHRPMFNSQQRHKQLYSQSQLRQQLHGVLHKYRVNAYIAGHYGNYMRTCAMASDGKCIDRGQAVHGLVHFTSGSAGAPLETGSIHREPWLRQSLQQHGYLDISTFGYEEATVKFRRLDGEVLDSVVMRNHWVYPKHDSFIMYEEAELPLPIARDVAEWHDYSTSSSCQAVPLLLVIGMLLSLIIH